MSEFKKFGNTSINTNRIVSVEFIPGGLISYGCVVKDSFDITLALPDSNGTHIITFWEYDKDYDEFKEWWEKEKSLEPEYRSDPTPSHTPAPPTNELPKEYPPGHNPFYPPNPLILHVEDEDE